MQDFSRAVAIKAGRSAVTARRAPPNTRQMC
jgi:hypothetical protein